MSVYWVCISSYASISLYHTHTHTHTFLVSQTSPWCDSYIRHAPVPSITRHCFMIFQCLTALCLAWINEYKSLNPKTVSWCPSCRCPASIHTCPKAKCPCIVLLARQGVAQILNQVWCLWSAKRSLATKLLGRQLVESQPARLQCKPACVQARIYKRVVSLSFPLKSGANHESLCSGMLSICYWSANRSLATIFMLWSSWNTSLHAYGTLIEDM